MIIVRLSGGMGNQMFQYATGRALSLKYGVPLQLDTTALLDRAPRNNFTFRDYALDVFCIQAEVMSSQKSSWQIKIEKIKNKLLRPRGVEKSFSFDPAVLSWGPDVTLRGYWQSPKYFSAIEDVIRADFILQTPLPKPIEILRNEILKENAVCIHIRRGDYVGNKYHNIDLGQTYYNQGLQYISNKQDIEKIYIFSDDIEWCKEHLSFPYQTIFVSKDYAGDRASGHFMLMRSCSHFIIPNSSFAWWAAWLAENKEKIVIAPKQWFPNHSIDTSDLIPPDWIRV